MDDNNKVIIKITDTNKKTNLVKTLNSILNKTKLKTDCQEEEGDVKHNNNNNN